MSKREALDLLHELDALSVLVLVEDDSAITEALLEAGAIEDDNDN